MTKSDLERVLTDDEFAKSLLRGLAAEATKAKDVLNHAEAALKAMKSYLLAVRMLRGESEEHAKARILDCLR